ncbi:MAG: hypothetical protein SH847_04455 [Roseiflexaceae bacterium]|nr:hypothetical protein [Roseiflexaceae bacterium]
MNILAAIVGGLKNASRFRLVLPLYLGVLLLSLIQIWPLFGNTALYNPVLGALADHTADVFVDLVTNAPDAAASTAAAWSGLTLLLTLLVGAIYNLFSGGMLSAWAGTRSFWAGSRYFFLSFMGLGFILGFLLVIAIAIGAGIGVAFGLTAGSITAIILAQLVNLFGEYARAAAVTQNRRNPLLLLGSAIRIVLRNRAGTLSLALIGLALHIGVALLYSTLTNRITGFPMTILLEQGVVLAWLWIKALRLAWALSVTSQVTVESAL